MSISALHLLQLVSPALPVGAFSYSEGLEVLIQAGVLRDGAGLRDWLEAELERGLLPVEAACLPAQMGECRRWQLGDESAALALREQDQWLLVQREAPEVRAQQRQMGSSLVQLLADLGWPLPGSLAISWPTAWAWAGVCLDLEPAAMIEGYLYGWVANQLSAAVRLVPLGPTEAQRLQLALAPTLARRSRELESTDPQQLWNSGLGASLAQLGHGALYSRLFRS
ncbi:MAG: urease accessory protein UreF [Cyanobacteriota bacterium]